MGRWSVADDVTVDAENVGGITETTVQLGSGVNVLTGRNATNRTSFLQAVMAGLGSDAVSLKGDADAGRVELTVGGETYTRTLERTADGIATGGDPYLDDPTVADLYAFLLEANEARQAVARGDDLRDVIMRPVDTDAIRRDIEALTAESRRVDDRLDELEGATDRRETLRDRRASLVAERESATEALAAKEAALDDADVDVEGTREERAELDARMDDLKTARSRLDDVRFELESNRQSLASVREEREELAAELDASSETEPTDPASLEDRLDDLREEKRRLDTQITKLQTLVRLNQELLDGDGEFGDIFADAEATDDPTAELLAETTATCWACGSVVEAGQFEAMLDRLRDLNREKRQERSELTERIEALREEAETVRERSRRREELERRVARLDDEIGEREATVEELEAERESLHDRVERLEEAVEELSTDDYDDVLDLHREANRLEFDLERLDDEIEAVDEELREVESALADRENLLARRDDVADELVELRGRIDRIERDAVDRFNEHMTELLALLGYGNIERIWIERRETDARERRGTDARSEFDLHVVRATADGAVYEDTVDHLSESEREVTGLVFALAGYLAHEVHETVPFVLLDSLEAIDADRIATLVDYFADYAPYLVVALLPEDAQALDDDYHRVTEI